MKHTAICEQDWARWTPSVQDMFDIVVLYGLEGNMPLIFRHYATRKWAIYVDLGYWGRREGGRFTGYHKVAVNGRHPTAYFRTPQHDRKRISHFPDLLASPWRDDQDGHHVLVCGMGDKGALAEGFHPEAWERSAIHMIRQHSERPIVYRPKPSWKEAKPIEGTIFSPHTTVLEKELEGAWAVVSHHSNACVDALVAGVPVFCDEGVAKPLSSPSPSQIERCLYPEGRDAWMADLAYTQWTPAEMEAGEPWLHLRNEGLI